MNVIRQAWKRFRDWKPSARVALPVNVILVLLGTLSLRYLGVFQSLEFNAYDFFIRTQTEAPPSERIVLVEMTEADIQSPSLDYPLYDSKLAELLHKLEAGQPAAIGLDIWRDVPVPKNGTGLPELNQALLAYPNLVAIFTLDGIAPPAVLQSDPERIAFNDNFPVDVVVDHTIPKVRRTLLFAEAKSGETFDSLPFRLALIALERQGIVPEADPEDPTAFRLGRTLLRPIDSNVGAYVGADSRGFQILLDFKCPDRFTRFSVSEALSDQIPAGSLRDKIVLVGINAPSVADERVTPVLRDHRGIEVQALTVNQLLRASLAGEPSLRSWKDWQEDAWVLFWCILGATLGYRVRSTSHITLAVVFCVLGIPAIAWTAFRAGWWIPAVTPAAAFVCATALTVAYASSQERLMRAVLMKLYSRHVSKEIAESIWANRDSFLDGNRPLAQKLTVTVLFTDLKGFSTISEKMEAARLYVWLNGYLGAMAQVIQEYGGVLKQFTGDGILALFGVPVPHATREEQAADASAAARCALAMGRRLVTLSDEWQQAGLPSVSMRAGIHTGEVAAGSVGSDDRFEYAVVGDVVNTAARLESYDKTLADPDLLSNRCRILVGGPTHELLDASFFTREIGLIQVKGKETKVPVFQVLGEAGDGVNLHA